MKSGQTEYLEYKDILRAYQDMNNQSWHSAAEKQLGSRLVLRQELGGGDFAQAYQAQLENGEFVFIKTHKDPPANFFSTEAAGLNWLADTGVINVPSVLACCDSPPYLVLSWVDLGPPTKHGESEFGRALAALHKAPFSAFGRPDLNTTGSLAVPNNPCETWSEFYATQRLLPLAKIASERNALPDNTVTMLESVAARLSEFANDSSNPSLLHGDLWAGNRVVDKRGISWIIDPAAHGGHREFDLAMMRLFGGYEQACFDSYNEVFPLEIGWQSRVALHQLAPLTVHAIKFGGSYASATHSAVSQYY